MRLFQHGNQEGLLVGQLSASNGFIDKKGVVMAMYNDCDQRGGFLVNITNTRTNSGHTLFTTDKLISERYPRFGAIIITGKSS